MSPRLPPPYTKSTFRATSSLPSSTAASR
uniref:Uncharacterized protein n=1 Tax=Arundo donax TaxID=35708 RepID=A0A0A9EJF4_ARUDO